MDDRRFDALVRSRAAGSSRRQVLKGMLGLGAVVGGVAVSQADASAKRRDEPPCTSWFCQLRDAAARGMSGAPTTRNAAVAGAPSESRTQRSTRATEPARSGTGMNIR